MVVYGMKMTSKCHNHNRIISTSIVHQHNTAHVRAAYTNHYMCKYLCSSACLSAMLSVVGVVLYVWSFCSCVGELCGFVVTLYAGVGVGDVHVVADAGSLTDHATTCSIAIVVCSAVFECRVDWLPNNCRLFML